MSVTGTLVSRAEIQPVVDRIVSQFRPRKVILFGSYASGRPTPDSDVDLMVLMDTDEPPLWAAARVSAAIDHPFPLDILVQRPQDWDAHLEEHNVFETTISREGVALYEAEDQGVD